MPGPITHLKAAYLYNKENNQQYSELLYLGSIVPDSVNIKGHAPKSVRWPAHLRDYDFDKWLDNATDFYNKNKATTDISYIKGYVLHIITDIVWDKYFEVPLQQKFLEDGIPSDKLKDMRWNELYGYEQYQVNENWFKNHVLPMLKKAKSIDIGTLKADNIEVWKNKVVNNQLIKGSQPKFINDKFMTNFFEINIEIAEKILK